jgi:dTDP-4-dehydrorhamnose reductase
MRRLLITGGTGYLGAELARQAADGWEVTATAHTRLLAHDGAHWLPLDIRDAAAIERAVAELRPEVVIHTAYRQSGPDLWDVTATGAGNVARAAWQAGARLIHMSSDVIFDGEQVGRYVERDIPNPISPYGEAKAAAERMVAEAHPGALIVRTSLIYGAPEPGKHEQLALDAAAGRVDLAFFSDELRCPIQVGDLAAALLELALLDISGPLHVAGADVVSRYEFARAVVAAHGGAPEQLRAALSTASATRRPRNCALDSSRAQRLLRTRLRGVREVLGQ